MHRFKLYQKLFDRKNAYYEDCRKAAEGFGPRPPGPFGLTGAVSGCHGLLTKYVEDAMAQGARQVIPNSVLNDKVRDVVKDVYGDDWDAAAINTCEAALWVTYDVLFSPPLQGRGDVYRSRYIAPYERHMHHQAGYGRPFPPRYKDLYADRGVTAGELGFYGKRLTNLEVAIQPLAGARYEVHGFKQAAAVLLAAVNARASQPLLARLAERHCGQLAGFASLGYDTPGYGYAEKDAQGTPLLQKLIAELARTYNVPYVVDNAWGTPFVGTDPRANGADVMLYSMDKAAGAPTVGLIIGREEVMVPIRRALGIHGERSGNPTSHGKAAYVTNDPGKEALLGVIASLRFIKEHADEFLRPLDETLALVQAEFAASTLPREIKDKMIITRSANSNTVEINYEQTGLPIFTIEDMYAGCNLIQEGWKAMGLIPTIGYDANIMLSPGLGTTNEDGSLIKDAMRFCAKAVMKSLELLHRYAEEAR
ncbi:MAG: hypothetical protein RDU89_08950 [bacterium]|nr:hypothetical protein [bacterium]